MGESTQASIIKLHTLEKEFQNTTTRYQQAYQTYINAATAEKQLIVLDGSTFWGDHGLSASSSPSIEDCTNQCLANTSCSGATFNSDMNYCWLRSGENAISGGVSGDYAIISEKMHSVANLQYLNNILITLNADITTLMQQMSPSVQEDYDTKQRQSILLSEAAELLEKKRLLILDMSTENNKYDSESQERSIMLNKTNIQLNFWMLFTLIIIVILIKSLLGKSIQLNRLFYIIIWLLLFLLTFNIKTLPGFLTWGILVLIIVLIMLKIIPSP